MFSICNLSLVPVRREPSDKSEMVSQLLFGEVVEILETKNSWIKIRMTYDGFEGWIDNKQVVSITDDDVLKIRESSGFMSADLVQLAVWDNNQICPVVIGSSLPLYQNNKLRIGEKEYTFDGNVIEGKGSQPARLIESAYMYLNSPYLWGGRSPFGIDCSGFTQMVFKLCGIQLKRDSYMQAEQGTLINLLEEAKSGDLAFFDNAEGKIVHVGILLSSHSIIHASGRVRIDKIDHQGIFNAETKKYSHNLRLIRRMTE